MNTQASIATATSPDSQPKEVADPASLKWRHRAIGLSFILVVILPVAFAAAYLWWVAKDQYQSTVAFSVQTEELQTTSSLFSGLSRLAGASSSASDQEILYQYIRSQDLVADLDRQIDLRTIYSRNWPADPLFSFDPSGRIEDLHRFWLRNVRIAQDSSGLMTVEVKAPTALEAQSLNSAVFDLASVLINRIAIATRDDVLRYSRDELTRAEARLTQARQEMTAFRLRSQIVDPTVDLQGQMGILNGLQSRLVDTLIELNSLNVSETDPRRLRLLQSRDSIEGLIDDERRKFGEGGKGPGGEDYATLFSEYERLLANLQFAEGTYQATMASYDSILGSAARQSRYLVAHIRPTIAERALFPQRLKLTAIVFGFGLLIWALGVLVYYSVRDRR